MLVASPTGTGKTLTGFLVAIDAAYRAHAAATERSASPAAIDTPVVAPANRVAGPGVVYVSPLRALAVDVRENLEVPLAGISAEAARLGLSAPDLSVAVRTGDTPAAERTAMRRSPPDLLVTTPESLYLLLTAASSRAILTGVHTVIVDEVHTLARDKRGPSGPHPRAVDPPGRRPRRQGAADRALGDPASPVGGGPAALRRRSFCTPDGHRRLRSRTRPRRLDRAPRQRARVGGQRGPARGRPRPDRRPRSRAPDHPCLREHPQDGGAGRPSARPATGCAGRVQSGRRSRCRPNPGPGAVPAGS